MKSIWNNLKSRPGVQAFIGGSGIFVFFCGLAVAGVIGNRADAAITAASKWIWNQGWWAVAFIIALVGVGMAGVRIGRWWEREIPGTSRYLRRQIQLDDTLLRLIPPLVAKEGNARDKLARLCEAFLADCVKTLDDRIARGLVLMVDSNTLSPIGHLEMPERTLLRSKFDVSPEQPLAASGATTSLPRGSAGKAFIDQRLRVSHMDRDADTGLWKSDDPYFHMFQPERGSVSYRSAVSVPIMWGSECLGVLCLDSPVRSTFDPEAIKTLCLMLGRRIAVPIMLYQHGKELDIIDE